MQENMNILLVVEQQETDNEIITILHYKQDLTIDEKNTLIQSLLSVVQDLSKK